MSFCRFASSLLVATTRHRIILVVVLLLSLSTRYCYGDGLRESYDGVDDTTTLLSSEISPTNDDDGSNHAAAVDYNRRSFLIYDKPTLLLSGSIHYVRVPPSDWNSVFQMAKELGLNCIQTYVIWSEHEPSPGNIQWEGYGDLVRFIELAAANDLYVVVRIGPYICGEYYFGGIPLWMRHEVDKNDGAQIDCFRCSDPVWKQEMKRWVSVVVDKIKPLLSSRGGPVIWMQIENEYDKNDDYLRWAVSMARNITTEVPWSLCGHNIGNCNQLNPPHDNDTTTEDGLIAQQSTTKGKKNSNNAVCTVNGFWVEQGERGSQPGPEFFHKLWSGNPTQPAVWTEDQGWFDNWLMAHRVRSTSDQLYGMARFFAYGGSYHNLYMLTGGNNYGLRAGRDATTAYAPDTVIDNFLLRHEPRFSLFQKFFLVMGSIASELLRHPVHITPTPLKNPLHSTVTAEVHEYGSLAFLSNFAENRSESGYFDYNGASYFLSSHTVVILNVSTQEVLFNTSSPVGDETERPMVESKRFHIAGWKSFQETVGHGAIRNDALRISPEQLDITENLSDYMWYTFWPDAIGTISIKGIGWGGLQYSYVDGLRSKSIQEKHLSRNVSPIERRLERYGSTYSQSRLGKKSRLDILSVAMGLSNQKKRVDILSVAMGLNTVVAPQDGKGIESVTIAGKGNATSIYKNFVTAWKLKGEELEIFTDSGSKQVDWKPLSSLELGPKEGLVWLQGRFDIPTELQPNLGGGQPNQTAIAVNLGGLNKGMAYVNGFNIGRYWLAPGKCHGQCAPPHHGHHCFLHYQGCDKPTQSLYHIPFELLKATSNIITLFEESTSSKPRNLQHVFLEVLHDHPRW